MSSAWAGIRAFLLMLPALLVSAVASAGAEIDDDLSVQRLRLTLSPEVFQITSPSANGSSLFGMGLGAGLLYGLTDRWGLAGHARQTFTTSGDFLFSAFEGRLTYAVTGTLIRAERDVSVDGRVLYVYDEPSKGGFRAQLAVAQYLFTTSVTVLPFSGVGALGFYEFASRSRLNYQAGLRWDIAFGSRQTLVIPQLFGGVAFWF